MREVGCSVVIWKGGIQHVCTVAKVDIHIWKEVYGMQVGGCSGFGGCNNDNDTYTHMECGIQHGHGVHTGRRRERHSSLFLPAILVKYQLVHH